MTSRRLITITVAALVGIGGAACAQRGLSEGRVSHQQKGTAVDAIAQHGNWAEVNGARLYYDQVGTGSDVILIHGFSLDTRMWDPQIAALMQHARITHYDVRGFGRSSAATVQHDAVADLLGLMDHLGIRRAHIVGMSMGGRIAIDFALTYPERTSSLALIGTVVTGSPYTGFGARYAPFFEAGGRGDLLGAKELWLRDPFMIPVRDDPSIAQVVRSIVMDCPCEQFADPRLLPGAAAPPAFERLEDIQVPTLVVVGEHEDLDLQAVAKAVDLRVPKAQRVSIPDAGHLVNLEQPTALNEALLAFWRGQQ